MQRFKTISFSDTISKKSKIVTVSFSDDETDLYDMVNTLTSTEIKNAIKIFEYNELVAIADKEYRNVSQTIKMLLDRAIKGGVILSSDVTFRNSKDVPFQRWYPYIEGYSPNFVKKLITKYLKEECIIYEPFAGTGTTLFAADSLGYNTYYSEINPLLRFLIQAKFEVLKLCDNEKRELAKEIESVIPELLSFGMTKDKVLEVSYRDVFKKSVYFPNDNFDKILKTSSFLKQVENTVLRDLLTVAVLSSLISSSFLKKQGDLRFKTKKELEKGIPNFDDVFRQNINVIVDDLTNSKDRILKQHKCIVENAKDIGNITCQNIGCVITSPPYLNGTNYIRNTKLELWFLGCLKSDKDLRLFRDKILTSGINDVIVGNQNNINIDGLSGIYDDTILLLTNNAYDVRIPIMAKCYFSEMFTIFKDLREKLNIGCLVMIDIGDSIFNNIHIKTDRILVELFSNLGYRLIEEEKLRERRSRNGQIISQTLLIFRYDGNL